MNFTEGRIKKAPADTPQGQTTGTGGPAEEGEAPAVLSEPGQGDQWCWISAWEAAEPLRLLVEQRTTQ